MLPNMYLLIKLKNTCLQNQQHYITAPTAICGPFLPIEGRVSHFGCAVFLHPASFLSCYCSNHQHPLSHPANLLKLPHESCLWLQAGYLPNRGSSGVINLVFTPTQQWSWPFEPALSSWHGSEMLPECYVASLQGEFLKINYSMCKM